jgi:hypothetical protein
MKKGILAILAALVFTGCTSSTEYGACVGAFEDKNPALKYNISGWNALMGVIGTSLLFVPTILVVKDATFCPVGVK